MITLKTIDPIDCRCAEALQVADHQKKFVSDPAGILAWAREYKQMNGICWGIYADRELVGLALVHDLTEEPACYHLCQLMIDERYQGRGYGQKALAEILNHCRREGRFPRVEVCVKKENTAAIHVYEKAGFRDLGYIDPEAPDSVCMVYEFSKHPVHIRLTGQEDLQNVQALWASPEVMKFVGFPEGLQESMGALEKEWLPWVQNFPRRQHYSIFEETLGYCGEAFYDVDDHGLACMDIKLMPEARGKGIASAGLSHALDQAFLMGGASRAYVDPNPENEKALRLYRRLGFVETRRAEHLEDPGCPYTYMEVSREDWQAKRGIRYRSIILRDLIESDIGDWIRWETVDTEWMDWDGPDLEAPPFVESEFREECEALLRQPRTGFRNFFELDTADGKHIGMVTAGLTGENYQYLTRAEIEAGVKAYHTLGIVICESSQWSRGLGTQALTAFCRHFLNSGRTAIRLQTWSGNLRMVRCAEKIGFVEVNRIAGNRHIRGGVYDGLTFQLDLDRFRRFLEENP